MSIEVHELTKIYQVPNRRRGSGGFLHRMIHPDYQEITAIDHIDFSVAEGESVAYMGPSGAGKSTTIRILSGILYPSEGTVRIQGKDPFRERMDCTRQIGLCIAEQSSLWPELPLRDSFRLLRNLYEIPKERFEENLAYYAELFHLEEMLFFPAKMLSHGQRACADIVAALLHDPSILFLDEPLLGIDIATRQTIRALIRRIWKERGITLFLTSHDLEDIQELSNRIIVIDKGRIISDVSRETLDQMFQRDHGLRLSLKVLPETLLEQLRMDNRLLSRPEDAHTLTIMYDASELSAYDLIRRVADQTDILDVSMIQSDMRLVLDKLYRSQMIVRS